jgi:hypothetical protein
MLTMDTIVVAKIKLDVAELSCFLSFLPLRLA